MTQYEAKFQINLGKAIPEVGDMLDRVNAHLSKDGYDEKLNAIAELLSISVTVDRELNEQEQYQMSKILESQVIQTMPQYDIRLKSFGRKSGNVQQSVS